MKTNKEQLPILKWILVNFLIAFCFVMIFAAIDSAECTPEEYWELKAELCCEPGVTLDCVKDGVCMLLEAERGVAVKDLTVIVFHYSGGPDLIHARALYDDGVVETYKVQMEAWGSTNWNLYSSIAGTREMLPEESDGFYGHPDTIKVSREWIVSTGHYDAWGEPEGVPDLAGWYTEYDADAFFETVRFVLDGRRVISIVSAS